MITLSDRVFIAMLATLALFVLVIEWRRNRVPPHVKPASGSFRTIDHLNVPNYRNWNAFIDDVAYIDMTDASKAGDELGDD